jgi:hypothetical protein
VHDIRCFIPLVQAVNVIESLDEAEITAEDRATRNCIFKHSARASENK